jgi:hypothetical protein
MITIVDGGRIPAQYQELVEVFSTEKCKTDPLQRPIDHGSNLKPEYKLQYECIYDLPQFELTMLMADIKLELGNGFIQQSSSSAAKPSLLGNRIERGLPLCVDY